MVRRRPLRFVSRAFSLSRALREGAALRAVLGRSVCSCAWACSSAAAPAPLVLLCFPRASAHLRGARFVLFAPPLGGGEKAFLLSRRRPLARCPARWRAGGSLGRPPCLSFFDSPCPSPRYCLSLDFVCCSRVPYALRRGSDEKRVWIRRPAMGIPFRPVEKHSPIIKKGAAH